MYGTVALLKPKTGQEQALATMLEKWWDERRPNVKGAIASTLHRNESNPAELIMTAVFDSKEDYVANAEDPEQDRWYQEMRALLDADPRWLDGEVLACKHT
jgi:quinol monooxygenase YgiN